MAERDIIPKALTMRCQAEIVAVTSVTPHMRRITLGGPDIEVFLDYAGVAQPGAWGKLFIPSGEGRAYTIRRLDRQQGTLDIDMLLHGGEHADGPVSGWAATAQVGEAVVFGGPRNSGFELRADTRKLLLGGDATALPAMMAILESLPEQVEAWMWIEVADRDELQPLHTRAELHARWLLADAAQLPPGALLAQSIIEAAVEPFDQVWLAGESAAMKRLRQHFQQTLAMDADRVAAKAYWKYGERDHRE